jgi:hypothetical protein
MGLDLSGIEAWTRELLDEVARKRGIRNPEFRRRGELVRLLLRQQYGLRLQAGRERFARGVHVAGQVRDLLGKLVSSTFEALPPTMTALLEPSPVRNASSATTRMFLEEPVRTRSVARALAAAGHFERASEVYAELIGRAPADSALAAEAAALHRGKLPPAPPAARSLEGPRAHEPRRPPSEDRLTCDAGPGSGHAVHWRISEAGLRRARAALGSDGQLTVRLLSVEPDPERVIRSTIIEHGPVATEGTWRSPDLPPQHRFLAAVGLLAGTRFVSIVHTQPRHETGAGVGR